MSKYRLDLKTNASRTNPPELSSARIDSLRRGKPEKSYFGWLLSMPLLFGLLYMGSVAYNHERVVPTGVETVQDFYQRYGNPPHVERLLGGSRTYYRIIGDIPAPLGFPRGNPIYIFDSTGRLLDWTAESHADPVFGARWSDVPAEEMTIGYFLEKFPPN